MDKDYQPYWIDGKPANEAARKIMRIGEGKISYDLGGTQIEFLRFGRVSVRLETEWLGFSRRKASILNKDGEYKFVGEVFGDGDMREPFFRYIGGA